jgi:hypothetical protein
LNAEIEALRRMTVAQLRAKYLELFGEDGRSNHKDFLFKRIAWRRASRLTAGTLKDQPDVIEHDCAPKVLSVEAILKVSSVVLRLRTHFVAHERAAEEDSVAVLENRQSALSEIELPVKGRDQNTAIEECSDRAASHYRRPPRRSASSRSSSRRFRSFAPDAACFSASFRRIRPNSEISRFWRKPVSLASNDLSRSRHNFRISSIRGRREITKLHAKGDISIEGRKGTFLKWVDSVVREHQRSRSKEPVFPRHPSH